MWVPTTCDFLVYNIYIYIYIYIYIIDLYELCLWWPNLRTDLTKQLLIVCCFEMSRFVSLILRDGDLRLHLETRKCTDDKTSNKLPSGATSTGVCCQLQYQIWFILTAVGMLPIAQCTSILSLLNYRPYVNTTREQWNEGLLYGVAVRSSSK